MHNFTCRCFAWTVAVILASSSVVGAEDALTYERDIRPIFRAHCFDCHGATSGLKGDLDLRLVRFMVRGGESGPAIVAGKPKESHLLIRIRNGEMPPGDSSVPPTEIAILEKWIAAGAPTARPEPESLAPGLGITPEERSFWSFQPIDRPDVPNLDQFPAQARVRTALDALVYHAPGFAPDADRRTLVLRAYFTLLGLPPTPAQLQVWLENPATDWYDQLLTELLESPHYGEQWARHWLDVAGYADSEGYSVRDEERPWAWKYRDWVIRALNQDLAFDQFITHQLAGDELAGKALGDLRPEQIDLLTATGFLRMAADGTGSGANNPMGRNQVMADTLKIVGTSLLGLSLQCAQCHDHRYDPIPQTDYYALRAVFEPALDWQNWQVPSARRISLYTQADRAKAAEVEAEAKKIADEKATRLAEYMRQALDQEMQRYEEPLRSQLRKAYETAAKERTPQQQALLKQHPSVNITPGNLYQYIAESRPKLAEFDKRIATVREKKPTEEFLRALIEPANHTPETKLFHRGDHQQPKQVVSPAALLVTCQEGERTEFAVNDDSRPTTGRRLAFARWLSSRQNPLMARVMVNRIWMHHFGKGIVSTPADFGKLGATPSHPQLLDYLADEFMSQGWSLKQLHRVIMTSTIWRVQSGQPTPPTTPPTSPTADFRSHVVRLQAETIRDRMLAVSGQLDRTLHGPPVKIKEDDTGQVVVDGSQTRRSLYIQARRSRPVAMLQTFDAPVMETNCESRAHSTVATQSLMLLNGQFILEQAAKLAERVTREAEPVASLPNWELPDVKQRPTWQFGWGEYLDEEQSISSFHHLPHWSGTQWQGGETLPDATLGWTLLHANGGHPDSPGRAVIRRWTASSDGSVTIGGTLSHPSPNGDGVRGRIVASRHGLQGEWLVHKSSTETKVAARQVVAGDTLDFVVDCRDNHTSDSFSWPVTIVFTNADQVTESFASNKGFRGPSSSLERLAGQVILAWKLAYCRQPSNEELRLAMEFLAEQINTLQSVTLPSGRTPELQAVTNLCQSLLSSNEFLYVE